MQPEQILTSNPLPFFYRLGFLANHFREPTFRIIERKLGLTRPEISTLFCVSYFETPTASEIALFTGHPKNTVSRAIVLLEGKGHLARVRDPDDGRRQILQPTPSGIKTCKDIVERCQAAERDMIRGLTGEEQRTLETILRRMCLSHWSRGENRKSLS